MSLTFKFLLLGVVDPLRHRSALRKIAIIVIIIIIIIIINFIYILLFPYAQ